MRERGERARERKNMGRVNMRKQENEKERQNERDNMRERTRQTDTMREHEIE